MKIERFNVALTSSDKFIELKPDPEGCLCFASEVAKLEALNAELLEALEALIDNVGSCICYDESEREIKAWEMAEAAIAKAEGETL